MLANFCGIRKKKPFRNAVIGKWSTLGWKLWSCLWLFSYNSMPRGVLFLFALFSNWTYHFLRYLACDVYFSYKPHTYLYSLSIKPQGRLLKTATAQKKSASKLMTRPYTVSCYHSQQTCTVPVKGNALHFPFSLPSGSVRFHQQY